MHQIEEELTIKDALKEFSRNGVKISPNTFKRKIGKGILPEGRQRGTLYSAALVREIIEQERKKLAGKKKHVKSKSGSTVHFLKVAQSDMPAIAPVIEAIFETYPDVERWQSWIARNPDIGYMLKVNGSIVGIGFVVPLAESKIQSILAQQITPPTLPDEVEQYEVGQVNLYVRSVGIIPEATHLQKRHWAAILVRGLNNVFIDLGSRGIIIDKIYSRSETVDGKRILRHMGFTEIPSVTNHSNFVIDVSSSGLKLIKLYKQALIEWQQRQVGE